MKKAFIVVCILSLVALVIAGFYACDNGGLDCSGGYSQEVSGSDPQTVFPTDGEDDAEEDDNVNYQDDGFGTEVDM